MSIVTPYFDTEEFFVETARSIFNQSLRCWEWIIVDDGSADQASLDRLHAVAASDKRIRVIRQDNAGPAAARNTAFRSSVGRFICLLDSDDMIEPTYLETCVWFLESNSEFSFCNSWTVVFGDREFLWSVGFERGVEHLKANSGPPISVIRRGAFEQSGGFDESIRFGHEDWDLWLAMAKAGHWGYTIPQYLQWYRKRNNGRFEEIMRSENTNADFEQFVQTKYAGLEASFPAPQRRHALPYESVETEIPFANRLSCESAKRRLLFVVPWMVTGGADRVNLDLVEGLVSRGHSVSVCATLRAEHAWQHRFSEATPDIFVLPDFLHQSDYPRFLAYVIESRGIDVVIITGSTIGYHLLPFLRSNAPDVAFLDLCHVEEEHWQNGGHPRFGVGYQDALDLNVVTTQHLSRWMQGRGADPQRIRVLYTGVGFRDEDDVRSARSTVRGELSIPTQTPVVVFGGRLCAQKRPAAVVEILRMARERGLAFRAVIVGDGELRGVLDDLVGKHGLSDVVTLAGAVPHERWMSLLAAADVFLLPSDYEGISVALLEAMASGVVPIASDVGGHREIVDDDSGFLVPRGSEEISRFADVLEILIRDEGLRVAMSRHARARIADQLTKEQTISNFETILDEARHLTIAARRLAVTPGLAREFATFAMEFNRLSVAADWLWSNRTQVATSQEVKAETLAVVRLYSSIRSTRIGSRLTESRLLRAVVRRLLLRLERRQNVA